MSAYFERRASRADRAQAAAAAVAINAFLGLAFLSGLALRTERSSETRLETFDVDLPPAPPPSVLVDPPQPRPEPRPSRKSGEAGELSHVTLSPQPMAERQLSGASAGAGSTVQGSGSGAGDAGSGSGGGGSGGGGGGVPASRAQPISGLIGNADNRGPRHFGQVVVRLHVTPAGTVDSCQIVQDSGRLETDETTCRLSYRIRFRPARLADGTAVEDSTNYVVNWRRR
jgi:protein TonB